MPRPAARHCLALLLALPMASAARPTDPGALFGFTPDDSLATHDVADGLIRVTYSQEGPNQAPLADADANKVPDMVELAADTALDVMSFYQDGLGLRPMVPEAALDLGPLGGSSAFDIYLVDFDGMGDGHFTVDACAPPPVNCAGSLEVENDFAGYGYPSPAYGLRLVTTHELFHGVQAAYTSDLPVWFSEGTAVFGAARHGAPGQDDLVAFGGAYLQQTSRTLYKPPAGPVPAFAYGTGLWFDFLARRLGVGIINDLLQAAEAAADEKALVEGMLAAIDASGDNRIQAWLDFASWNLATGPRAGLVESYPYAQQLQGLGPETSGPEVDDEGRFYPLAARYYRLKHTGGPLWFGLAASSPGVWFTLHPTDSGSSRVLEPVARFEGLDATAHALQGGAPLDAGDYWLVVANVHSSGNSTKVRVCLGGREVATRCAPEAPAPDSDTPDSDTPDSDTADSDTSGATDASPDATSGDASAPQSDLQGPAEPAGGCSQSAHGHSTGLFGLLLMAFLLWIAGRRSRAPRRQAMLLALLLTGVISCGDPGVDATSDAATPPDDASDRTDLLAQDATLGDASVSLDTAQPAAPKLLTLAPGQAVELVLNQEQVRVGLATPEGDETFMIALISTVIDASAAPTAYWITATDAPQATGTVIPLDGCSIDPAPWGEITLPDDPPPSGQGPDIGDKRTFQIRDGFGWKTISAEAVAVGQSAVVWTDTTPSHPANLDPDFAADFHEDFESLVLPRVRQVFGLESDIDQNGHIHLLFSPLVYDAAVAYYSPCDHGPLIGCGGGNEAELLYLSPPSVIPEPYNTAAAITETLAHELQHLIHHSQKVLAGENVSLPDNAYMLEGAAALSQDISGFQAGNFYVAMAGLDAVNDLAIGDMVLDGGVYDMPRDGALRGGAYLFMRWLYDRAGGDLALQDGTLQNLGGPALMHALLQSELSIWGALPALVDASPQDLVADFYTALALSNREDRGGVAPQNPCFRYLPTVVDPVTGRQRGANLYAQFHGFQMKGPKIQGASTADGELQPGGAELLRLKGKNKSHVSFVMGVDLAAQPRIRIARIK